MTKLPHEFKRIRLNLARSKEFPAGSDRHGYEFVAPLDANGHIDPAQWQKHRENCGVRRFWNDEEEHGRLVHKPGGAERGRWVFDYSGTADEDENEEVPELASSAAAARAKVSSGVPDASSRVQSLRPRS
jgi:hypothetical protein